MKKPGLDREEPLAKPRGKARPLSRKVLIAALLLGLAGAGHETVIDGVAAATETYEVPALQLVLKPAGTRQSVAEGQTLQITASATDPAFGNPIKLSATPLPDGATFDSASGVFSWTPAPGTAATIPSFAVTFTAKDTPDPGNPQRTINQTVTIYLGADQTSGNQPPRLDTIPSTQQVVAGEKLTLRLTASDPEGGKLKFSASQLPPGARLKRKTGIFQWKPKAKQIGQRYTTTFIVKDKHQQPAQDSQSVEFTVVAPGTTTPQP